MAFPDLLAPLALARGPAMANRLVLAPLTNLQSHADGRLSEEEFRWLTMRAQGGFGLTMTCAAHVQPIGQGYPGQLGIFGDEHLEGLTRLSAGIRRQGGLAVVQLHHAGIRADVELIGQTPVCPSDNAETGARALTLEEVERVRDDFIAAAVRAEKAGFDGVELHGAHGYLLCEFLSPQINQRTDGYGGSVENRRRLLSEIIAGVRARCRADFTLGLRLSPERFGADLGEIAGLAQLLMRAGDIDYLDMSLWDFRKAPADPRYQGRSLMSYFTELDRGAVRLGVAGAIMSAQDAREALAAGADFVLLGKAAILHHDFPQRVAADPDFAAVALPVSADYLAAEGVTARFLEYLRSRFGGMVESKVSAPAQ